MPGGGFGIFNGCTTQWNSPSTNWGQQYGGVSSTSQCDTFPEKLKAGCKWRFDWFLNADNPSMTFRQITCPKALTDRTGCVRAGEVPTDNPLPTTTTTTTTTLRTSTTSTIRTTTTSSSSSIQTTTRSTTAVIPTTTSAVQTGPLAQHWEKCGGESYTGPTTCVLPWKCNYINPFYSQCL